MLDHAQDGVENFVSIVGGKLTTYRLMAEHTADAVCAKLGVEMIPVPLTGEGPDMAQVRRLAERDARIKGIWCVPLGAVTPPGVSACAGSSVTWIVGGVVTPNATSTWASWSSRAFN